MGESFAVDGIDHVELYVSDWDEAAAWYERVLGMTLDDRYRKWWESRTEPLVLSTEAAIDGCEAGSSGTNEAGSSGTNEAGSSGTKLALFEQESAAGDRSVGPHRVAFRTDAAGFLAVLDRLEQLGLTDRDGDPVTGGGRRRPPAVVFGVLHRPGRDPARTHDRGPRRRRRRDRVSRVVSGVADR